MNCLIEELKKLKESSKEAVEGMESFSKFKEYMHIKRTVQNELFDILKESNEINKAQLVLVCGGVGDGKSHLISYFNKHYREFMKHFKIHNDATESFSPQKTSIDTLNDELDCFSDEKIQSSREKMVLAINLGALNNFIDSEYGERFTKLREFVIKKGILGTDIANNSFDVDSNFQFVNFSDYHVYSLKKDGPKSEYIEEIIQKVTQNHHENIFYRAYEDVCNNCISQYKCPVKLNYEMLMNENVRFRLCAIVIESIVKHKMIVSTRALLNFIYDFIVHSDLDNMNVEDLKNKISKLDIIDIAKYMFTSNLFEHGELSNILAAIETLDPINVRNEELDNVVIKLNITDDISDIFIEYLDMEQLGYFKDILLNKEALEDVFKVCKDEKRLKGLLIKTFIRLYLFLPNKEEINLKDDVYNQYMNDLYNRNKGIVRNLKRVYDDVKESIYKWNGENIEGNINIFVGKSQMRYKVSQKLNIEADISNLKFSTEDELYKFDSNLVLGFKNEEKGEFQEIDIDINLYKLLMAIKNGYRPNKVDKYNHINFIEFINKISKWGNQSKEVIIEDRSGKGDSKYKLSYDKSFEVYKFERIGGI